MVWYVDTIDRVPKQENTAKYETLLPLSNEEQEHWSVIYYFKWKFTQIARSERRRDWMNVPSMHQWVSESSGIKPFSLTLPYTRACHDCACTLSFVWILRPKTVTGHIWFGKVIGTFELSPLCRILVHVQHIRYEFIGTTNPAECPVSQLVSQLVTHSVNRSVHEFHQRPIHSFNGTKTALSL